MSIHASKITKNDKFYQFITKNVDINPNSCLNKRMNRIFQYKLNRLLTIVLVITLLIGCFSSCASKENISSIEQISGDTGYTVVFGDNLKYDSSVDVNGGSTITISFWYPDDVAQLCETYIEKYQDMHYNVTFDTKSYSWSKYWTELEDALGSGTGPDIFWMNTAYQNELIDYAQPLSQDNFPEDDMAADFRNYYAHEIDGDVYFVDLAYTAPVVIYDKDKWFAAGLTEDDYPTNWVEFEQIARLLTEKDSLGNIEVSGFDFNGSNNFVTLLTSLNYQSGEFQFSENSDRTTYSSTVTIDNMEYLKSYITTKGISEYTLIPNRDALGMGMTAMICDYTWVYLYILEIYPDSNIGVFAMPEFDNAPAITSMMSDVSPCIYTASTAEAQAVSEDFLKFLLSYDAFIKDYSIANSLYPSKYSLEDDKDVENDAVLSVLAETIDRSVLTVQASANVEYIKMYYLQELFLTDELSADDAVIQTDLECTYALYGTDFDSLERYYKYLFLFDDKFWL